MSAYHDRLEEDLHENMWSINRVLIEAFFVFSIVSL